jgi:alcohol dehydrogenase (cytochrome c)
MRRARTRWSIAFGLLLLGGGVILAAEPLRWRAALVGLKATGKVSDISWAELSHMLRPGSTINLRPLRQSRNPYQAIANPDTSTAAVAAGALAFGRYCASCHGREATGGQAPPLVGASLRHGSSDWALYRAIAHGFPRAGMPDFALPVRERWEIAAFLRGLRREPTANPEPPSVSPLALLHHVTPEALVSARSDSADWLTYSGAYDGRRYSKLSQINRSNVGRLRLLWMHQVEANERFESTPLAIDGVLFFTTPLGGVRALDAETGSLLWSHQRELGERLSLCCGRINRGLAVLGNTLYLATLDAHLRALDARTGRTRWDVKVADPTRGYSFTSAPLAVKDLIIVGSAGGEFASRGFIDAYDAETGQLRWRFATIPEPGVAGNETWSGSSWKSGGGPAWLTGSYDSALDLIYWGVGNPNPDLNGDARLGDNLYTNSVVALDRATGTLRWHFQFTPHDEHDWDATQIEVLLDSPDPGSAPLLVTANRNGFYYVLDRSTGRFLRATAFARQSWATGIDPRGRPILRPGSAPTRQGSPVYPGFDGATNWWSPSYSPRTGSFYVQAFEREDLVFKGPAEEVPGVERWGSSKRPMQPGSGRGFIRALDAATGERRWEFQTHATLGAKVLHAGGLLSTGGDLLFGAAEDRLLALDATNGLLLWSFTAGGGVHAAPISYLVRGKQRLTVAAGHALLTFGID